VLPHFTFFGSLSFVVELALGVSLLFGLLTVLSGIGGALWRGFFATDAVGQAARGTVLQESSRGYCAGLRPGAARGAPGGPGRTGWPGTAVGRGIYLFQSQRRTLHDKAGPFNDDPFLGFCDAGPCCNFLGTDAPTHC